MRGVWGDLARTLVPSACAMAAIIALSQPACLAHSEKSGWIEVRSPHFIVDSNSGKGPAKATASQFEQIRQVLSLVLTGVGSAHEPPLTILAVDGEFSLKRLLPGYFKKRGQAHPAGLFFDSPAGAFVVLRTDVEDPGVFEPVYHEYTHFVMRQLIPGMPLWLTEGLADFFAASRFNGSEIQTGLPDPENLRVLRSNPLIPLATLLAVGHSSPYYTHQDKVAMFYAESWALAHYLMLQDVTHHTQHVGEYIAQVAGGVDPVAAFTSAFGPPEKVGKALDREVHEFELPMIKVGVADKASSNAFTVRPLTLAEADSDQANFLVATGHDNAANKLIARALKANPNFGEASALKSAVLLSQGNESAAAEWAAKAIKLDPGGYLGYLNRALAMDGDHLDTSDASTVEQDFARAIALRPGLVIAEQSLSSVYLARDEKPDRALALAIDAARSAPENTGVLIDLEAALLRQGRQADAVRVELQMLDLAGDEKSKAMVRNDLGWALLELNIAPQRASFEIQTAAHLEPGNADIQDSLGHLLEKQHQLAAAASAFRRALAIEPKLASSLDGLGDVLRDEHDWQGAATEYSAEILLNPQDARAHYGLSMTLQAEGDAANAAKEMAAAKTDDPFNSSY